MILGADITVGQFIWNNLIPVTIGNIISGILFVGLPFYFLNTKSIPVQPIPDIRMESINMPIETTI